MTYRRSPLGIVPATTVVLGIALLPLVPHAFAQRSPARPIATADEGAWHTLSVTGGQTALTALGVPADRPRGATMIELIRRLHFSAGEPVELAAAVLELSTAVSNLDNLQNAIALGSSPQKPLTLALAGQRASRKHLQDALAAAGLELKETKKQYRVEIDTDIDALALRTRLSRVGLSVVDLKQKVNDGGSLSVEVPSISLPLPLSPQTWAKVIFERDIPPRRLFVEILQDPSARLLYHGLAGLDAETRRWMGTQPELLRRIYRNDEAVRSFSLFGPALKIAAGRIVVPGGKQAEERWSDALDIEVSTPDRFVRRLFDHDAGRTAGLYFTIAAVDEPRQAFLLGTATGISDGNARFRRLVSSFANCYPGDLTSYPFALRSYDAALLLLEVGITGNGTLAGPTWRRFWSRALSGDRLPANPADDLRALEDEGSIDAAWMVDALCGASPIERGAVFVSLLAGHRTFAGIAVADLPDTLVALRARRLYPAVVMALEQGGIRRSQTHAAVARHAELLARLDDRARGITALQQFQGALALTINALAAGTLELAQGERLLESLAAVRFEDERYDGRLVDWLSRAWLPAVQTSTPSNGSPKSPELVLADALAMQVTDPGRLIQWEGESYTLDFASAARKRLLDVRKRQGGVALDSVLELNRISTTLRQRALTVAQAHDLRVELEALAPRLILAKTAAELDGEGPNVEDRVADVIRELRKVDAAHELDRAAEAGADLTRAIDFLAGHTLASWAYTPHVGEADGASMVGGDGSLRHQFGFRSVGSDKFAQRWKIPLFGESASLSGSLLGLQAGLAKSSLRRLSSDAVPPQPTIIANDLSSFMLTVALSNPRHLLDRDLTRIGEASAAGTAALELARQDPAKLVALAREAAMSPWTRESLSWMAAEEGDRLLDQFSLAERVRLGGLAAEGLSAWGTASLLTGCMCLQMPQTRIPEVIIGRRADGLLGGHSADLMIRIATILTELKLPAPLAAPVIAYAMSDFLDQVVPVHGADFQAFARQARALERRAVEDYVGAIAAVGLLRPVSPKQQ